MTFWMRSSNMPRSMVPGDHRVHLQVHDLAVAQPDRHRVRLELDPAGEPFDDRGLADARLADQHHRVGALAVAEDLEHLLDLLVAAEHRRQLVLAASRFRLVAKCLRNGGSSKRFFSRSSRSSMSRIRAVQPRGEHLRLDAVAPQDGHRGTLRLLEHGQNRSTASMLCRPARLA